MRFVLISLAVICAAFAAPLDDQDEFTLGNRAFTAGLYKGSLSEDTNNLIVSPISIEAVLAMTYEGAKGDTADELVTGLSLPSTKEKVEEAFQTFLPKLKGSAEDELTLSSANKIYIGDSVDLDDNFATVVRSLYRSDVETVNFAANIEAANEINEWVEEQTNGKIQNLVDPDSIGQYTDIVLVNALYLGAKWAKQFVDLPTTAGTFYVSDEYGTDAHFMHQKEYFEYYENEELDAKFIDLPLKGGDISLVIALPNKVNGLATLEENLEQVLEPQPLSRKGVDLSLPKFSIETEVTLVPILEGLGVEKLFDIATADLSGISTNKQLYVSNMVQKAFINVTEGGIEAAAATDVVGPTVVVDTTVDFEANHPFLYYIKASGIIIFAGRVVIPS